MIVDVDVYLAHHGVKGQKWGVRKSKQAHLSRVNRVHRGTQTKAQRNERNIRRVHAAVKITSGALFVASLLSTSHSPRYDEIISNSMPRTSRTTTRTSNKPTPHVRTPQEMQMEQARLNGAFQVRRMLQDMGEDVI